MKILDRKFGFKIASIIVLAVLVLLSETTFAQGFQIKDLGTASTLQDTLFGIHKRGRALVAADFDLDGTLDIFMGNPGDQSFVLKGFSGQNNGKVRYQLQQVLLESRHSWGAVSFDYDNDGDYDLFIACGGSESTQLDYLFRNDYILNGNITGNLVFTDVTEQAGVAGMWPDGSPQPVRSATANAVAADYDGDGFVDLFANGNDIPVPNHPELTGRNTLWHNNGDGTFTDVTEQAGLANSFASTRHATFLDYDNDGDKDLFENNYKAKNIMWRNNGDGTFTDVTASFITATDDISYPVFSFASASADFNNDGWQDLICFMRGSGESGPYQDGHAIFINSNGTEFTNIADEVGINATYVSGQGVMGCQVGDLNGDGVPDVYVGNGGPSQGTVDRMMFSELNSDGSFFYNDVTPTIDFPARVPAGVVVPPYPYRTHGTAFIDADNDGTLEIAVNNGGPASRPDEVREPNRLFKILLDDPYNWFKLRPIGDGINVSRDAIGTRVSLRVRTATDSVFTINRTLFGGSAFSAQNGFDLHFAIGQATTIDMIKISWPNGTITRITEGLMINESLLVEYNPATAAPVAETGSYAEAGSGALPEGFDLKQNYPNPFNPSTTISYQLPERAEISLTIFSSRGQAVRSLVSSSMQEAGTFDVVWNGTDDSGRQVASGVYFYTLTVGAQTHNNLTRKMLLLK